MEAATASLGRLVGSWSTEATHPAFPGVVVAGTADIEWLEGGRFLIQRSHIEHPDFPDSIAVIGDTGRDRADGGDEDSSLTMHYFDSRGVFRVYQAAIDETHWRLWRDAPGLSQRFTGTVADDGRSVAGLWEMCTDGKVWNDDLQITYRRN